MVFCPKPFKLIIICTVIFFLFINLILINMTNLYLYLKPWAKNFWILLYLFVLVAFSLKKPFKEDDDLCLLFMLIIFCLFVWSATYLLSIPIPYELLIFHLKITSLFRDELEVIALTTWQQKNLTKGVIIYVCFLVFYLGNYLHVVRTCALLCFHEIVCKCCVNNGNFLEWKIFTLIVSFKDN